MAPEKRVSLDSEKQIRKGTTDIDKGPAVRLLCVYFDILKFLLLFLKIFKLKNSFFVGLCVSLMCTVYMQALRC